MAMNLDLIASSVKLLLTEEDMIGSFKIDLDGKFPYVSISSKLAFLVKKMVGPSWKVHFVIRKKGYNGAHISLVLPKERKKLTNEKLLAAQKSGETCSLKSLYLP